MINLTQNTLPAASSNATQQLSFAMSLITTEDMKDYLPFGFPYYLWADQADRYSQYWMWQTGEVLEEIVGVTKEKKPVYRYPLKINPVRDFARKHNALLFGEVPDSPNPLVTTRITPKAIFGKPQEPEKELGEFLTNLVSEVWLQSNGRSIQYENGAVSQFLGGCVFQVAYQPWRTDLTIPIVVKSIYPNYFLPIWAADDYYNLQECWIVYLVDPVVAQRQWGIEPQGQRPCVYAEHWTRDWMSISVNGTPLNATYPDGTVVDYAQQPNPFGFVPFVYIPRIREGAFYGSSLVPDISGLALEYNARMADVGDAMRKTVHQRYTGTNINSEVKYRKLDENGNVFLDLGNTSPINDETPEVKPLDAPKWDKSYSDHQRDLWAQLMREGGLGPIAFGEDEGSQRSALTLAFRMWPSTIVAKAQRTFWTDGITQIAKYILTMALIKRVVIGSKRVPEDFLKRFAITPQWLPMIPRDREALVNEMILRAQTNQVSPQHAQQVYGDVPDVDDEIDLIKEWMTFMSELQIKQEAAKQALLSPVASSGLKEGQSE